MKYTEEEIREAIQLAGHKYAAENIIGKLKMNHSHDWSDDDMISVKEIREAWARGNSTPARNSLPNFLTDISEHREHFEHKDVVQDPEGNIWRLYRDSWQHFGSTTTVSYGVPRRPLKLLAKDSRKD